MVLDLVFSDMALNSRRGIRLRHGRSYAKKEMHWSKPLSTRKSWSSAPASYRQG